MDWNQISAAVAVLLVQWGEPFNVVLFTSIAMFCFLLYKANKRPDFSVVDALRDDNNKASFARIAYGGAFITSTWTLMSYAANKGNDPHALVELFIGYGVIWAIPKVAEKYIEARYGKKDGQ